MRFVWWSKALAGVSFALSLLVSEFGSRSKNWAQSYLRIHDIQSNLQSLFLMATVCALYAIVQHQDAELNGLQSGWVRFIFIGIAFVIILMTCVVLGFLVWSTATRVSS